MNAAKPPSGAWIVIQRAGRWPSVRNEWATYGGAARKPPAATVILLVSRPISKVSSPLEDVEGVGVVVVDVWAGYLLAGRVPRVGDRVSLRARKMLPSRSAVRGSGSPPLIGTVTPPV
jgi:hypothetical protein